MILLFFSCIIMCLSQTLMLDSRELVRKQLRMNLFKQEFSIWFTYNAETNIDRIDLFKITNYQYLIVKIQAQQKQLIVTYDEDQIFLIQDNWQQKNKWTHLVFNQNQDFQKDEFYIKTTSNVIEEYQFKIDSKRLLVNESLISLAEGYNKFCLIYDRQSDEIKPIIQSTNLQLLIIQLVSHFYSYHSDSAIELFLKKHNEKYGFCSIIEIYSKTGYLLKVIDFENQFQILIQSKVNFMDQSSRIRSWFRILIKFNNYEVQYEIQFIDEKIVYSFGNINRLLFYQIIFTSAGSNYQFMKMTTYFKGKNYELFDEKQLQSLKNCNENIRQYIDIEKNECYDYMDLDQIQIIEHDREFDSNKLNQKRSIWDEIGKAISRQVFSNLATQDKYPFVEYFKTDIYFFTKEPYLLWSYYDKVFCNQNYFGQFCKKFISNCIFAIKNQCSKCVGGYLLIRNKCQKCPQNCLFCVLNKQQFKCLLPKINHFVNKKHQARLCMFQFCNTSGSQVSKEQAIKQVQQCFDDSKCLLKDCFQTHQYFRLEQQDCYSLSKDQQLQIYYYLFYQDQQYSYGLEQIQFLLALNYQLYGDTLLNNMISDYYLILQMDSYIQKSLEFNFEQQITESQYQNRYNLDCFIKNLDQYGEVTCKEYIKRQNNKCSKLPCFYRLEIKDIFYYIGDLCYFEYKNNEFQSLFLLLGQVKNLGLRFNEVYLQINLIIQGFDENNQWEEIIDFQNKSLFMFKNSTIIIDLVLQQQIRVNFKQLILSINADQITIQNQFINIPLFLNLKASIIKLKGLTISQGVNFQFNSGLVFMMQLIEIQNDFWLTIKNFQFVDISDFLPINQSCFSIELIKNENIKIFNLQLLNDVKQCMKANCILKINQFLFIKLTLLTFKFNNNFDQTLIQADGGDDLIIENMQISINRVNSSNLILLQSISSAQIYDCSIQISHFAHGIFLVTDSTSQLQIRNYSYYSDLFVQSNLLQIKSNKVWLIQINITLEQFDSFLFILVNSGKLVIIQFDLNQNSNTSMGPNYNQGYLIELNQVFAEINNFNFNGIQVSNIGLLFITSGVFSYINQLSITNIKFQTSLSQKVVRIEDDSTYMLNLLILNIQIYNQALTSTSVIEVRNYHFFQLINCSISTIYQTQSTNSFLFIFNSILAKVFKIVITDCKNVEMIFVQSIAFEISQLKYYNNKNSKIIDVYQRRPKFLLFQDSSVYQQEANRVFYATNPKKSLQIIFKNVQFYFYQVYDYFFLSGRLLLIKLNNVSINQFQTQDIENSQYGMFYLHQSNFQVTNMVINNLYQPLFFIDQTQKFQLFDLVLSNSQITEDYFLFYIQDSPLILENVKIASIHNLGGIFYISSISSGIDGFIRVINLYVQDVKNVTSTFEIQSTSSIEKISYRDLFISNLLAGQVFKFGFDELQEIHIQGTFVNNVDNFLIKDRGSVKLNLNTAIVKMRNFKLDDSNLQVRLTSAEIIFENELKLQQIQFDRSYIYNSINSSIVIEKKFSITLSLNSFNQLKQIQLDSSDKDLNNRYLISQDGSLQYYFYVPSGQQISKYKQLNFKTLSHEQVYKGLYLVVQGFINGNTQYKLQCTQKQFYNNNLINQQEFHKYAIQEGLNDINEYLFIINPFNKNYTEFKITCSSDIDDTTVQLQYNVKAFPCQLGEFLFQNQCLECNISYNQYSVILNSNKCNYIDNSQIKSVRKGLLYLNQNYWRYKFTSNIIEYCDSNSCNGGWVPGDQSCIKSRIGALCEECDIYNIRGDGSYTKSNQSCLQCEGFTFYLMIKLLFTIIWQLLLILNGYYSNYKLSQQYLMFKIGFRQYYKILYRQSIDVPSIIIKMFANYIFMLYVIKSNLNITGYTFINSVNIINNPGLITKAQMDCILSEHFEMDIIYSSFIFQIILVFFIISVTYTIYLTTIQIKKIRFELGLILYVTEAIIIYNLNIILVISLNLLSYQIASGQKWIKYNMQYLFFTDKHFQALHYIVPATVLFMGVPLLFPTVIKSLSVFYRQVKRIYAIYHQQYNPKYIFWDYLILYIKYAIMIFQNLGYQSNQNAILIMFICLLSVNLKPYYLQNLNLLEYNLYIFYGIQLLLLNNVNFIDEIIILLNLLIFVYVTYKFQFVYFNFNLRNIIQWKLKIISKFYWIRRYSRIDQNQRLLKNKLCFIYLVKSQILKKSYQTSTVNQGTLQTEQEIEMPIISKQLQSKMPQTRQEIIGQ